MSSHVLDSSMWYLQTVAGCQTGLCRVHSLINWPPGLTHWPPDRYTGHSTDTLATRLKHCPPDPSTLCEWLAAVGQFKELVESSETDQPLQETLKKVLNFTSNGWQKAREHAMRAVSTDNRMRAWCADDSLEDGLLFKCYLGRVDLEAPVGESIVYHDCTYISLHKLLKH